VPGVRDVRTLGWPLMVVVGVLGCEQGCPRTSVALDKPLMVVVGVSAGSPDLHTQALSRCDGRGGPNTPPRYLDTLR
jgi:hypothetical protein